VQESSCSKATVSGTTTSSGFTLIGVFTIGSFSGCPAFRFALLTEHNVKLYKRWGLRRFAKDKRFQRNRRRTSIFHTVYTSTADMCISVAFSTLAAVFQAFPQVWPDTKLDSMMIVAKRNIYNPRRE
jgi:hypothetical protein